jgi:hypothetical protein
VETGVQSITGSQKTDPQDKSNKPDPQKVAQDDATKKKQAWANIQKFNQQYTHQSQLLRQQNQQKEQEKNQQDVQKTNEVRQFEFVKQKKDQDINLQRQKTRAERKGSIGG